MTFLLQTINTFISSPNIQIIGSHSLHLMDHKAFFRCLLFSLLLLKYTIASRGGQWNWELLMDNTGVVAMHMAVTRYNKVLIFDQTQAGPSSYPLTRRFDGWRCRGSGDDLEDSSCYAHALEYDIKTNIVRPLHLATDTWCSSGSFLSNGTLLQTGGHGQGSTRIRYYRPCDDGNCDWIESKNKQLLESRWYSSSLYLPQEKTVIVVGGRGNFTYEFIPKSPVYSKAYDLPFLHQTYERNSQGNNLYPFLHLSNNGHLFIFANRDSILFDYRRRRLVKNFPRIPGKGSRSYPSSGSSVLLPLDFSNQYHRVEVMICGGAVFGAYAAAQRRKYLTGLRSCGRMIISGDQHKWKMEDMPGPRLMSDMLLLPTGDVLIINGARKGCAGWNNAIRPALQPYLYQPKSVARRFQVLNKTNIARLYHSSAGVLPDGRILVAGGNPNRRYASRGRGVRYRTELRLQALVPDYMSPTLDDSRPINLTVIYPGHGAGIENGDTLSVDFWLSTDVNDLNFMAYAPPFTTHGLSMNQRMVRLRCSSSVRDLDGRVHARVAIPLSVNVAPPGYYLLTVVNAGIPSKSAWFWII